MTTGSEVARLCAVIAAEQEAAERALDAFRQGSATHAAIAAHMEGAGRASIALAKLVGDDDAGPLIRASMEGNSSQ